MILRLEVKVSRQPQGIKIKLFCANRNHVYNLKNVKNTHGRVLIKVTILHGCFSRFLNCTNSTKLRKVSRILIHSSPPQYDQKLRSTFFLSL